MGIAEEAADQMANLGAAGFLFGDQCAKDVGAAVFVVADIAFAFEDANGGKDGVVGEGGVRPAARRESAGRFRDP